MTVPPRQPTARKGAERPVRGSQGAAVAPGASTGASGPLGAVIRLSAPIPPSTNHLYATVNGHRVKTKAAREYAEHVSNQAWLWTTMWGPAPLPPYRLTIVLHPATRRRTDLSNAVKCLEDAVFAGIKQNDKTVVQLRVSLGDRDPLNPRADVTLEHVEPLAPADREES